MRHYAYWQHGGVSGRDLQVKLVTSAAAARGAAPRLHPAVDTVLDGHLDHYGRTFAWLGVEGHTAANQSRALMHAGQA